MTEVASLQAQPAPESAAAGPRSIHVVANGQIPFFKF